MLRQEFKSDRDDDALVLAKAANIVRNTVVTSSTFQFSGSFPFTHYHINVIRQSLGPAKSPALPIFHSFAGCDTTSTFHECGKKKSWEAWKSFPDVTEAFAYSADYPFTPLTTESPHFHFLFSTAITLVTALMNWPPVFHLQWLGQVPHVKQHLPTTIVWNSPMRELRGPAVLRGYFFIYRVLSTSLLSGIKCTMWNYMTPLSSPHPTKNAPTPSLLW